MPMLAQGLDNSQLMHNMLVHDLEPLHLSSFDLRI